MPTAFLTSLHSFAPSVIAASLHGLGFKVCGTVSGAEAILPGSVREADHAQVSNLLSASSVVIVSLNDPSPDSLKCPDSVLSIMKFLKPSVPTKLIVVSNIGTWGNTVSSRSNPVDSSSYSYRAPAPRFANHKRLEDFALSLSTVPNLSVSVITPGVLYGMGEDSFYPLFRDAFLHQSQPVQVPSLSTSKGKNALPTTHVLDLTAAVISVATSLKSPLPPYALLVDKSTSTLEEITQSVSGNLNGTKEICVAR